MKKIYIISYTLLVLCLYLQSARAQRLSNSSDSTAVSNVRLDSAGDTNLVKSQPEQVADNLIIRRIPVKAGDSISVSATVLDNTSYKARFLKSLTKAVVPAFIIGRLGNRQASGSAEQPTDKNDLATVGVNLAVVPGAIELASSGSKLKTFVGLTAYDADSKQVALVTDFMTKAARKDWEKLQVGYRVEKDGFVEILGNSSGSNELLFETGTGRQDTWIRVGKYNKSETPVSASADTPVTMGGDRSCIAWYWCTSSGCQFIGIECNPDNGDYYPGGGGGGDSNNRPGCAECKNYAQREHDRNLTVAKAALTGAVAGGCHYAGFQTFVAFNTAGWWVNLVPGIGTAAIEALSSLGGITVDIGCLVSSVLTYNAAEATIENNYYKDIRDCKEKYTDCD